MRPRKPAHREEHGTETGYKRESVRGEGYCDKCRRAHAEYMVKRRTKLRKQRTVLNDILTGGQNTTKLTDEEFKEVMRSIKEALKIWEIIE